uniref:Uncharacterized protein n=1 Tax=Thermofilum adornatum TaxID=1365176 RepID=A0A7C1GA75_9CREN
MSDVDEKIKDWQKMAEALTGKIVFWLGKEAARGAVYATVASFMQNKLPSMFRSGKSEREIIEELTREINQSVGTQQTPSQEEVIRRIIQEELSKMRTHQMIPPQTIPPQQVMQVPQQHLYPTQAPAMTPYDDEIRRLEDEIQHYERLKRMLEERWVKGEIQEEEFRKKLSEIEAKLGDLRLRKQRIVVPLR